MSSAEVEPGAEMGIDECIEIVAPLALPLLVHGTKTHMDLQAGEAQSWADARPLTARPWAGMTQSK